MDINRVVDKLNDLVVIDRSAMQKLIEYRVKFSDELAKESCPFIVGVDMEMGVIGLLNGLMDDPCKIGAMFEKSESGELILVEFCFINPTLGECVNDVSNK